MKDQYSALQIDRGDLKLSICEDCGFVFNGSFAPSKLRYGKQYDNQQSFSKAFDNYLSCLVRYLIFSKRIKNYRIVEVGCGRGTFLRKMVEIGGNIGWGVDPSYSGPVTDLNGRLTFNKTLYGPKLTNIKADVIVCRHVIEHVPNPLGLLSTIRKGLLNTSSPRLFLETPSLEWILQKRAIWDFYYEHCSYFTAGSLTTALQIAGFKIEKMKQVFGKQYLWVEAVPFAKRGEPKIKLRPGFTPYLTRKIAKSECEIRRMWGRKINEYGKNGRIAIWGAGAKGVTFANLIDPKCRRVACVIDLNPNKQGKYLPGTGHPIASYRELKKYGVICALLMNSNYKEENQRYLKDAKIDVQLIDLIK